MNIKKYLDKVLLRDIMALLKELPDKCVDMVYGDPDYNVGIKYGDKSYTRNSSYNKLKIIRNFCKRLQ